jgi:hypothetical protein
VPSRRYDESVAASAEDLHSRVTSGGGVPILVQIEDVSKFLGRFLTIFSKYQLVVLIRIRSHHEPD